eukprot:7383292-Prymnesium_polylepis.1
MSGAFAFAAICLTLGLAFVYYDRWLDSHKKLVARPTRQAPSEAADAQNFPKEVCSYPPAVASAPTA